MAKELPSPNKAENFSGCTSWLYCFMMRKGLPYKTLRPASKNRWSEQGRKMLKHPWTLTCHHHLLYCESCWWGIILIQPWQWKQTIWQWIYPVYLMLPKWCPWLLMKGKPCQRKTFDQECLCRFIKRAGWKKTTKLRIKKVWKCCTGGLIKMKACLVCNLFI